MSKTYTVCVCWRGRGGVNKRDFLNVKEKIVILANVNKQGWLNFVLTNANGRIVTKIGVEDFTEKQQCEGIV